MLKKFILIFLLFLPITANASIWSAIGSCFSDPCNCGDSDSNIKETWNGTPARGKKNKNCPPWNKGGGRNQGTCLLKKSFPGRFIGYYENLCGEQASDSTYAKPTIRVRGQQCNAAACWTTSNTLAWDGRCVTLASGYGIPLHRMCARIAIPANYATNFPQDPGYTEGVHLNFEGATVPDDEIKGYDDQVIKFNSPKLCLYKDPAFFSFKDGLDVLDLDPNRQPFHLNHGEHPVIKAIIFVIEKSTEIRSALPKLLSSLFDQIDSPFTKILSNWFKFISWLFRLVPDLLITTLKGLKEIGIGQINAAVDDTIYGCVNLPMGPFPPPFCPTIDTLFQTASTQKICRKDSNGTVPSTEKYLDGTLHSTQNEPCVVSTLKNNLINNSIRVTFENFVPLCKNGEDPLITDKCVTLDNLGIIGSSASVIHSTSGNTDIIPPCVSKSSGPCVKTKIPHSCSVSEHGCQGGFRVVYGLRIGSGSSPQSYFMDDLANCGPDSTSVACQEIWGINTSEFIDISLTFPKVQIQTAAELVDPLFTNVTIKDKTGESSTFKVTIVKKESFDEILQLSQSPTQICVSQGDQVIGCENRAPFIKPKVYEHNDSSYYTPKFIATISDGTDSTSALVEPKSISNPNGGLVNLAGYNFDSFVTDDTYGKKPFSGPKSPNPSSLFGTYQDDASPINPDYSGNENAIYLYGLEYVNDEYNIGGKYACLENVDSDKCPENVKNCVLAKLDNDDIVKCEDFISKKLPLYPDLTICTPERNCPNIVDHLTGINGGVGVDIYSCGTNEGYCYKTPGKPKNLEICKYTSSASMREDPKPDRGETLSDGEDYYHIDPTKAPTYDPNHFFIRDKTARELNLCVTIPQPKCPATTIYNEDSGFASWPETTVGEIATGVCQPGLNPVSELKRRCVPTLRTGTTPPPTNDFQFEPLYRLDNSGKKVYGNVKCKPDSVVPPPAH